MSIHPRACSVPSAERPESGFDVFLAHNSADAPSVEIIATGLSARGMRPWFGPWEIPPGRLFQKEIERVLPHIKSIAVVIGPSGIGPWEEIETDVAISQFVRRRLPVIPVMVYGTNAPELPLFLQEFSWVRFSSSDDAEALDNLVWGITGEHPGRKAVEKS